MCWVLRTHYTWYGGRGRQPVPHRSPRSGSRLGNSAGTVASMPLPVDAAYHKRLSILTGEAWVAGNEGGRQDGLNFAVFCRPHITLSPGRRVRADIRRPRSEAGQHDQPVGFQGGREAVEIFDQAPGHARRPASNISGDVSPGVQGDSLGRPVHLSRIRITVRRRMTHEQEWILSQHERMRADQAAPMCPCAPCAGGRARL